MVALLGGELVEGHRTAHLRAEASWSSAGVGNGGRTFQQARASNSFEPGSSAPGDVDAVDIVDSFWCSDSAAGQPRAGGAGVKVGGLTAATQAVFGVLGVARNDANTCCAQGDARVTKWPIPANSATVELGSVRAAIRAQLVGVTLSKLPASSRVGIVLGVAARCYAGAVGNIHTVHPRGRYVKFRAGRSTEAG